MVEETSWNKQKTEQEERKHETGFESHGDTGIKDTEVQTTMVWACKTDQ